MSKLIDLTGKKFGRLTVIERDTNNQSGRTYWRCKCECGNEITTLGYNLTSGRTQSCGCLIKEITSKRSFKDLTGKRFGKLTVLELDKSKTAYGKMYWKCKCDCGNIITVFRAELMSGDTQSCGCKQREYSSKHMTQYNKKYKIKSNRIEFDSNYGCLRVYFNNCDEYFLCDLEDKDIVEKYCWYKGTCGYVYAKIRGTYKNIRLQRAIMSKYYNIDGYVVDHINHNILDNRKSNLRLCTSEQNLLNRKFISKSNTKYEECNDEFYYNPNEDFRNRNKSNIIHPFIFINPENIIQPFNFDYKTEE